MNYIKSEDIKLFPSILRGAKQDGATTTPYNPDSRLTNEENLTGLSNRFTTRDSFVQDWDKASNILTICIHGYYFRIHNILDEVNKIEGANKVAARIYVTSLDTQLNTSSDNMKSYEAINLIGVTSKTDSETQYATVLDQNIEAVDRFLGLSLEAQESDDIATATKYTQGNKTFYTYTLLLFVKEDGEWIIKDESYVKFLAKDLGVLDDSEMIVPFQTYIDNQEASLLAWKELQKNYETEDTIAYVIKDYVDEWTAATEESLNTWKEHQEDETYEGGIAHTINSKIIGWEEEQEDKIADVLELADEATDRANTAAGSAETATTNANNAAREASDAAIDAETATSTLDGRFETLEETLTQHIDDVIIEKAGTKMVVTKDSLPAIELGLTLTNVKISW